MVAPKHTKHTLIPCGTCRKPVPQGNCPAHPKSKRRRSPGQRAMTEAMAQSPVPLMCAYCDHRPATATDHVIPRSVLDVDMLAHFGILSLDDPRNLLPACRWCNTSKGGRRLMGWVMSGRAPDHARELLRKRIAAGLPY